MKKVFLALMLAVVSLSANAQFDKGTKYLNASLSGLSMSYSKDAKFKFGIEALGGYFIEDAWMLYGKVGYQHQNIKGDNNDKNNVQLGVGGRYYIKQNGLYIGCGLLVDHVSHAIPESYTELINGSEVTYTKMKNRTYFDLTPEIGYCFYLNHYVSIEPSVYYNMCLNHFSEGSEVGLKIGVGYYF